MKTSEQVAKEILIEEVKFKQYFQASRWADYNRKFFNSLAPKYDFLNQVITLGMQDKYKSAVIASSPIKDGDLVLDVCTGSGDMTLLISKKFKHAHIIGVDVADKMLEIAKQKAAGKSNVEFMMADAMNLPFEDQMFDMAIMSYGLRNLSDFKKGIMEMKRVTKKGGAVVIVDLGKPKGIINRLVYGLYFERLMPFLGKHLFHRGEFNSFKYLPESNKHFPSSDAIILLMQSCGLKNITTKSYMMGIVAQLTGEVL